MVEDGGLPVTATLRRTDPFHPGTCRFQDPNCIVETGKDCAQTGCIYEITCSSCQEAVAQDKTKDSRQTGTQEGHNYIGMTMSSVHSRMKDHLKGQRAKSNSNPLWRHDQEYHEGEPQRYKTRILNREQRLLPLSVLEGLYIEAQRDGTSMNEKNERGRGGLVRLVATRGLT